MIRSRDNRVPAAGKWLVVVMASGLAACAQQPQGASPSTAGAAPATAPAPSGPKQKATGTIQDLMFGVVAPAANDVWASVSSTVTIKGLQERQPRTAKEWAEVRRRAVVLAEAANLLLIPGRRVANGNTEAGDDDPLDVPAIQQRLDSNAAAFAGFADGLGSMALKLVDAIDRKDVPAISDLGGELDQVCEACHLTFWYPETRPQPATPATAKPTPNPRP